MITDLSEKYRRRLLSQKNPLLFKLHSQGIGDIGEADISDTYVYLRASGYYEHLIIFTLSGEGWLHSAGTDYVLNEGSVWISPAGTSQEYGISGSNWHIFWITLSPNRMWNVIDILGTVVRKSSMGNSFLNTFNFLFKALENEYFNKTEEIDALCSLFLVYVNRELLVISGTLREQDIKAGFQHLFLRVSKELEKPWNICMLQQYLDHSYVKDYFGRLCKQYYGKPPMQVVKELRMKRAWELICHTFLNIYYIAERVGYTNPYAFSTAFKKYWNMSPTDARKLRGLKHTQ
jgi:AraC-like DNA-binding protein